MPGGFDYSITPEEEQELASAFANLRAQWDSDPDSASASDPDPTEPPDDDEEEQEPDGGPEEGEETESPEEPLSEPEPESEDASADRLTPATAAELRSLRALRASLDAANASGSLQAATSYQQQQPPVPAAPGPSYESPYTTPPEDLDLEDPNIRALWDKFSLLGTQFEAQRQQLLYREQQESVAAVNRAVEDWNTRYHLDETTFSKVRQAAANLNILPNLAASGKSPYDATVIALDTAFWSDSDFRDAYVNAQAADDKARASADRAHSRKLSALAGRKSAPSAPKPVSQMSADERREAMAAEIAEHLARS